MKVRDELGREREREVLAAFPKLNFHGNLNCLPAATRLLLIFFERSRWTVCSVRLQRTNRPSGPPPRNLPLDYCRVERPQSSFLTLWPRPIRTKTISPSPPSQAQCRRKHRIGSGHLELDLQTCLRPLYCKLNLRLRPAP